MTTDLVGDASKWRIFAASWDTLLAAFAALLVASRVPGFTDSDRVSVASATYLAYFFVQEGLWSTTLGKRVFGLRVRRLNGSHCGWGRAFVRTITRVVEANPVLIGGLPAALLGAFSSRHQRLGDLLGGCVVVRGASESSELGAVQQGDEADER
jgi:uncharacterized RDD family membrane protein YckC